MQFKQIVMAVLLAGIGGHAFANEMYKAKVVEHKQWVTGGSQQSFAVNGSGPVNRFLFVDNQEVNAVTTIINSGEARVSQSATLNSFAYVMLHNSSKVEEHYLVDMKVCTDTELHQQYCLNYHDVVNIAPGGFYMLDKLPRLVRAYSKPGLYKITSKVFVAGDASISSGSTAIMAVKE